MPREPRGERMFRRQVPLPENNPILEDAILSETQYDEATTATPNPYFVIGVRAVELEQSLRDTFKSRLRQRAAVDGREANDILQASYRHEVGVLSNLAEVRDVAAHTAVIEFYQSLLGNPAIANHRFFSGAKNSQQKLERLLLNVRQAPNDLVHELFKVHYDQVNEANQAYQERTQGYRTEFSSRVPNFLKPYGDIVTPTVVDQRFTTLQSILLDPVLYESARLDRNTDSASVASYDPDTNRVLTKIRYALLAPEQFPQADYDFMAVEEEASYKHELVHGGLGGKQGTLDITGPKKSDVEQLSSLAHTPGAEDEFFDTLLEGRTATMGLHYRKAGLSFYTPGGPRRFSWLDEAVTEGIRREMYGLYNEGDAVSYLEHDALLNRLLQRGRVPLDLVRRAYLENEPQHTRLLLGKLRERFGAGFMVKMDIREQEQGINAARRFLEQAPVK